MRPGDSAAAWWCAPALLLTSSLALAGCRDPLQRPAAPVQRPAPASRVIGGVPWRAGNEAPVPGPVGNAPAPTPVPVAGAAQLAAAVSGAPRPAAPSATTTTTAVRQILWESPGTGVRALWEVTNSVVTGTSVLGYVPQQWQILGAGDFDSDGKEDIVFQDTVNGTVAIWRMNGSGGYLGLLLPGTVPPTWRVVGAGDYNSDGKDDILFENLADGRLALWLMDGAGGIAAISGVGAVPPEWHAVAARDMNGDGKADILWQNVSTGGLALWLMDGHGGISSGLGLGAVPTAWQIAGTTDFDGDGNIDVLWQNAAAGGMVVWYMNGSGGLLGTGMSGYTFPAGWRAATVLVPDLTPALALSSRSLSAGYDHTCALNASGSAYCWGKNNTGQLGDGTRTTRSTPVAVTGGLTFSSISSGEFSTCALQSSGQAVCWGENIFGQFGNGASDGVNAVGPTAVSGGLTFASIAASWYHTCGLTTAGQAYCWGTNFYGQIGDGNVGDQVLAPTPVSGGLSFSSISTGWGHTCALTRSGQAYCWGSNTYGELGTGVASPTPSTTPVAVTGGLAFSRIATSGYHTCAITATGGTLYCWGFDGDGELGDGTQSTYIASPTAVAGGPYSDVVVNDGFTCALAGTTPSCWGYNYAGQLGTGQPFNFYTTPQAIPALSLASISLGYDFGCGVTPTGQASCWGHGRDGQLGNGLVGYKATPVLAGGVPAFAAVSAGYDYTCGLTSGGQAYCWGYNGTGQLGINSAAYYNVTPTAVSGSLTFAQLSAGASAACGVSAGGTAYCWGRNLGGSGNSPAPTALAGGLSFARIAVGAAHACGYTTAGAGYCWGNNANGQLGIGSLVTQSTPVAITGGLTLGAMTAGSFASCGLTTGGAAYCWGLNRSGLGTGVSGDSILVPTAVLGGLSFSSISNGNVQTCALTAAGQGYCWGNGSGGQLGTGSYANAPTPALVSGGLTFTRLVASPFISCGLTSAGQAYCWGANDAGQLGSVNGSLNSNAPLAVSGGHTFVDIAVGDNHACGLTAAGALYCWGDDDFAELGDGAVGFSVTPVAVQGGLTFRTSARVPAIACAGGSCASAHAAVRAASPVLRGLPAARATLRWAGTEPDCSGPARKQPVCIGVAPPGRTP